MAHPDIQLDRVPRHVAIIMDGNGRWAVSRGLERNAGHREGIESVREVIRACRDYGVEILTLYAFSIENWNRPRGEVSELMRLLVDAGVDGRRVGSWQVDGRSVNISVHA